MSMHVCPLGNGIHNYSSLPCCTSDGAAPTIADLDGDGRLEVIIGTSVGFLYVLNCSGESREGWPIQMGDMQVTNACLFTASS